MPEGAIHFHCAERQSSRFHVIPYWRHSTPLSGLIHRKIRPLKSGEAQRTGLTQFDRLGLSQVLFIL
jgi:hypothetical protein